ncbi:uncharacterized protein L201_000013 [Kwoniella dendrophila CBS 6074]|uniref:Peptidase C14 caspase domain-containing protein n=1 Tax=Kwoniella dendrophila CBS 6074 TaxID=1295534 RepID=A0AAX4JI37_9TREE
MSADEYEGEYYNDGGSREEYSEERESSYRQDSRHEDSYQSRSSRSRSDSSSSDSSDDEEKYEDERGERDERYERQDSGDYDRRAIDEPSYTSGEYTSQDDTSSVNIASGVAGAFGAMVLGGLGQHQQTAQQYGGYDQGYQGGDHRGMGADQYNYVPPPGSTPNDYYPTAAGYVPQQQYQADQPPYGTQYRGDDDGQPHQQHYGPTFADPQTGEVAQPFFEYSRCNGTRKALLIGINYFGTSAELSGCINDVHNVQKFICERYGYRPADIVILTDDSNDPRTMPTRDNIIKGMKWLVQGAQRDDALFLHYSGHGTQTEDLDGDEGDGDDEAICPVDYETAGLIIDDDSEYCNGLTFCLFNRR